MWKNSYHPCAAVAITLWSLSYTFTRLALQHFSAFSLGFLRYLVASAALAVFAACTKMKGVALGDLPRFLVAGATGFFLYMITFNQGQSMVSASTASILIATTPVITALLARIFFRETLRPCQWAAIAVEFSGVTLLMLLNGQFSVNAGLLWLLAAALLLSIYNLLQRNLTKTYSAMQVTSFSIFCGTLMLAVFSPTALREAARAPAIQIVYLLILGIGSSAVGYVFWAKAFIRAAKTSQVSNYMFLTPFLATLIGFLLSREVPNRATVLGGGIILLGVFLFNFGDRLIPSKTA